jgi:DNA-binding transcriptional ArsR family regulator
MSTSTLVRPRAQSTTNELSRDVMFTVLSNPRRRDVLRLLRDSEEPTGISDLAERIAAWETDTTMAEITYKERKRVYTSLHQTHLPALEDAGLIEAVRSWEGITLTPRAEELDAYLDDAEPATESPWSTYYFGFASIGLAMTSVAWLGVYPFAEFSGLAYATLLSLALFITALVHAANVR